MSDEIKDVQNTNADDQKVKPTLSPLVTLGQNIANLFKVKTILTLSFTGVFCFLASMELPIPEEFMTLFTMVVGFYFGTQSSK